MPSAVPEAGMKSRAGTSNYIPEYFWDVTTSLQWRHNERDGVSNHQPPDCLLNRSFKA